MNTKTRVAAIIPAYNEAETIGPVVSTLVESELIQEVIVVSDGSTDETENVARQAGASKVIRIEKNSGKGNAMLRGVTLTSAPVVLFVDADLIGFTVDHVERIVMPVISGAKYMNVGIRDRGRLSYNFSRFLPLIGGERALKRSVIEGIPAKYISGYMVESAMNYYCRSHELPYGRVFLPGLKIRKKIQKVGVLKGIRQYIHMTKQVLKAMVIVRMARIRGNF